MIKGRGLKRQIDPRSIWAGRQRHEISKKVRRIKGKIGKLQNLLNKARTKVELSRFLFIFLHSHQQKHHGRVPLSWFFIFLLQVSSILDYFLKFLCFCDFYNQVHLLNSLVLDSMKEIESFYEYVLEVYDDLAWNQSFKLFIC